MPRPNRLIPILAAVLSACALPLAYAGNDSNPATDQPSTLPSIPELAASIRQGHPENVAEALSPCLALNDAEPALEQACTDRYSHLASLDERFIESLNAWLEAEPKNAHARLIAAGALISRAWTIRGHAPAEQTHPKVLNRFRQTLLQAATQAARAVQLEPDLPYGYSLMTAAYGPLGEQHQAQFRSVLSRAERSVPWSYSLAVTRLFLAQRSSQEVSTALDEIVDDYSSEAPEAEPAGALASVASVLRAQRLRSDAGSEASLTDVEATVEEAIDDGLTRAWVFRELAVVRSARGDNAGARAAMATALERDPYSETNLFAALCACPRVSESTALKAARRYVERYPDSVPGWRRLAAVHRHYTGDLEQALSALRQAEALRPDDPRILLGIRALQRELGREVDGRFDTLAYKRDLIVYSHRSDVHMARVRDQVKARFASQFEGDNSRRFDQLVSLYFTVQAFDEQFRGRLDSLQWPSEHWAEVSTLFADSANIAAGVSPQRLNALRTQYSQPESASRLEAIYAIRDEVTEAMVADFVRQLNEGGSQT